jgi:hypothetical protein
MIHFGVDTAGIIDSIKICWPSGKQQTLHHIASNRVIEVFEKNATDSSVFTPLQTISRIVQATTADAPFVHHEDEFNDFKRDKIIPHQVSRQGPAIAVADVDNDGLEDYYVSGAKNQAGALYVQTGQGDFQLKQTAITKFMNADDETVAIWADLDKNGLPDLITGIGSNAAFGDDTNHLHVAVYYNKGNLLFEQGYKLPAVKYPVGSISVADIDNDGDMDVFVGCRIVPGAYGVAPQSYLFENRGNYFADITNLAPGLQSAGMVTSSAFADLDGDKKAELIIAGEFMPVTIYKNTKTGWQNITTKSGLGQSNGLWSCIKIADINNDGHPDILGGNWGDNSIWRASTTEPLSLWVNDFDGNGSTDPILFHYLNGVNAPFVNRDLFCKQMPKFFNVFNNYESYAHCTDKNIFDANVRAKTAIKYAYTLNTTLFLNDGKGNFTPKILPSNFQLAPINTFITYDFDHNGTMDILPLGNTNSNFYDQGDIDALRGKIFSGDGHGNFDNGSPVPDLNNKTVVNSSAVIHSTKTNTDLILVGVNNDTMKTYVILKAAQ